MSQVSHSSEAKVVKSGASFVLTPLNNDYLAAITGEKDAYLTQIEMHLGVKISHRAEVFFIEGEVEKTQQAESAIKSLYAIAFERKGRINAKQVHFVLLAQGAETPYTPKAMIKILKNRISPRNAAQAEYLKQMLANDVCFGLGPAGTGKTYLAVACAAQALANHEVERIVLVRPAVEAGEKLGFLPGDISQKVDPYLRPLYDALYEMLGVERVGKLIERGVIELAPLAYMRGRTLNSAYILLDEAQNTTVEQMKMFLTRMGQGSKMVITGDTSQIDLPKHIPSGLLHVQKILTDVKGINFTTFSAKDVVRHSLVQKIVEAYEAENKNKPAQQS
ncbi:MAG: PhoH family protein [Arenicellales bacterium]